MCGAIVLKCYLLLTQYWASECQPLGQLSPFFSIICLDFWLLATHQFPSLCHPLGQLLPSLGWMGLEFLLLGIQYFPSLWYPLGQLAYAHTIKEAKSKSVFFIGYCIPSIIFWVEPFQSPLPFCLASFWVWSIPPLLKTSLESILSPFNPQTSQSVPKGIKIDFRAFYTQKNTCKSTIWKTLVKS